MSERQIYLESLGCARNTVDSDIMLGRLKHAGWTATTDPARADTIVINTCSFIEPAVNESIDTILELAGYKRSGICKRLIVVGCLPERYREEIAKELPRPYYRADGHDYDSDDGNHCKNCDGYDQDLYEDCEECPHCY